MGRGMWLGALLFLASATPSLASPRDDSAASAKKPPPAKKSKAPTDAQLKKRMIADSIAAYSGNCPCPYNTASNGSSCGRRSAWSRAGGESPLCYASDISAEMVEEYRRRLEEN